MTSFFAKIDSTIDGDVCFYDSLFDFAVAFMRMDTNVNPSILSNI